MVFFGDPVPDEDSAGSAVAMALAVREDVRRLANGWQRRGHDLALGVGVAQGYATLGRIGYPGRSDYAAIGSVTNLAARLCSDGRDRGRSWSPTACWRTWRSGWRPRPSATSSRGGSADRCGSTTSPPRPRGGTTRR